MTREEAIWNASDNSECRYYEDRYKFKMGAEWADEHPKSPWISVNDRLPEEQKCESDTIQGHREWYRSNRVLVLNNKANAYIDSTINGKWISNLEHPFDCDGFPIVITHWMPIPPLNEEE